MKTSKTMTALFAALLFLICLQAWGESSKPPVDLTRTEPISGKMGSRQETVTVAGRIYEGGYLQRGYLHGWAVWRIPPGYTTFEAAFGIDDEHGGGPTALEVCIDGQLVKTYKAESGQIPVPVLVSLNGATALKLKIDEKGLNQSVVLQPNLLSRPSTSPPAGANASGAVAPANGPAPFVVDPNDLEKLAVALRKRVDQKPEMKQRIAKGQVALMTFTLVDIPSASVATNVAEDLYTSMINNDFPLVERGQLDKILKELKIQDTALIDPKTAQKIGQLSGCDVIVLGSISDRGQFVVINARLMETATGKSLAAERVEMRKIPINRGE